jgi:NAD(P)-dependent dehydrogenase (short-subunit alcohol dehydrogenase family)
VAGNTARFSLEGKCAFVTGAGRGIGLTIAAALAEAGATVALAARSRDEINAGAKAIAAAGGNALPFTLDVADPTACRSVIPTAAKAMGGLDILVNNAGVEQTCPALDIEPDLWDRILDTNLRGAFFAAQAAGRFMASVGKGGTILNLCSLTSEIGIPTAVPYGSSKTGLLGMTRALAVEWAPLDIRVNAIAPGYFRTHLTAPFFADQTWRTGTTAKIPLGRFGEMDDLAGAVVYLVSDSARYVTGQCLAIDGGMLASL